MGASRFTSIEAYCRWLGIAVPAEGSDTYKLFESLLSAASAFVLQYIDLKSIALAEYSEILHGYGGDRFILPQNPVQEVSALYFGSQKIPASTGNGFETQMSAGYYLDFDSPNSMTRRLNLKAYLFPRGPGSISVRYTAGFVISENRTIPATPHQITTQNFWFSDVSVVGPDGSTWTKVDSAPGESEYSVEDGVYTFNVANEGEEVAITYSFCPADIQQAVWELAAERYKYMDRIGYKSKTLGGQETVVFDNSAMSAYVKELLMPYKKVIPY